MKYIIFLSLLFSININAQTVPATVSKTDDMKVCESIASGELESYNRLIKRFGTTKVDPSKFKRTENGLQSFIDQSGIRYFSAAEVMTPHNEAGALACGLDNLIPPQCIWSNGAALMSILERMRELIAGPIMFRNWYRPTCYNSLVEGAKGSDHLLAKSVDIDFRKPHDRAVAQKFLCEELWKKNENIQVGIGCNTLHIGLASPRGKRFWVYGSMANCPVKTLDKCWSL